MSLSAPTLPDITRKGEIELLPGGWHALECDAGRTFRWVNNDAAFLLPPARSAIAHLQLELEAGPGMGRQHFQLTVRGPAFEQVLPVRDRQFLSLVLPLAPDQPSRFTLHSDGGGHPCPNDDRQLNFRVFLLTIAPDIVNLQSGVDLLSGWEPRDPPAAHPARIARSGASFRVHAHRDFPVLCLDLDPASPPTPAGLRIDLLDAHGHPVSTTAIAGRQLIGFRLNLPAGAAGVFSLHLEWIGQPAAAPPFLTAFSLRLN